ncbi:MAG: DUF6335 family protein [Pyrinomonadaceae bacterium]
MREKEIDSKSPTNDEIRKVMDDEIAAAPQAPGELAERLAEHHAASPADSGGDIEADWEEVNSTGAEAVFGHNPTPDQSDAEANAHAMGIDFQDKEPLDILEKLERRDRERYELDEDSKARDDSI